MQTAVQSDLKGSFQKKSPLRLVWGERIGYINAFCLPRYLQGNVVAEESDCFPLWSDCKLFGNERPLHVEYCSGNGSWIVKRAKSSPERNWIAVELRSDRAHAILRAIQREKVENLFVLCGDGRLIAERCFPEASVSEIYINFPDPWPKRRHEKHRLITASFAKELQRTLKPKETLTLVTDDCTYGCAASATLLEAAFTPFDSTSSELFVYSLPEYGLSYFEQLWRQQGRPIYYYRFVASPQLLR